MPLDVTTWPLDPWEPLITTLVDINICPENADVDVNELAPENVCVEFVNATVETMFAAGRVPVTCVERLIRLAEMTLVLGSYWIGDVAVIDDALNFVLIRV